MGKIFFLYLLYLLEAKLLLLEQPIGSMQLILLLGDLVVLIANLDLVFLQKTDEKTY
jgi:hypothetical protein